MTECRLGGCGPVAVMRTGPHLGGGPVFKGRPRPCRSSPRGRTSATASVHGGISSPPGMPDGARFAGNRRASCVWRGCGGGFGPPGRGRGGSGGGGRSARGRQPAGGGG